MDIHSFQIPVAIPYNIGHGLAGGDWEIVKENLEKIDMRDKYCLSIINYNN